MKGWGEGCNEGHSHGERQKYRPTLQHRERERRERDMQKRGGFRYCWFLEEVTRISSSFYVCVCACVRTHLILILV